MATSNIPRHYGRILSQWPKDLVRPSVQFQDVLRLKIPSEASKVESQPAPGKDLRDPTRPAVSEVKPIKASDTQAELRNINALYTLLDDRYAKKVCPRAGDEVMSGARKLTNGVTVPNTEESAPTERQRGVLRQAYGGLRGCAEQDLDDADDGDHKGKAQMELKVINHQNKRESQINMLYYRNAWAASRETGQWERAVVWVHCKLVQRCSSAECVQSVPCIHVYRMIESLTKDNKSPAINGANQEKSIQLHTSQHSSSIGTKLKWSVRDR